MNGNHGLSAVLNEILETKKNKNNYKRGNVKMIFLFVLFLRVQRGRRKSISLSKDQLHFNEQLSKKYPFKNNACSLCTFKSVGII